MSRPDRAPRPRRPSVGSSQRCPGSPPDRQLHKWRVLRMQHRHDWAVHEIELLSKGVDRLISATVPGATTAGIVRSFTCITALPSVDLPPDLPPQGCSTRGCQRVRPHALGAASQVKPAAHPKKPRNQRCDSGSLRRYRSALARLTTESHSQKEQGCHSRNLWCSPRGGRSTTRGLRSSRSTRRRKRYSGCMTTRATRPSVGPCGASPAIRALCNGRHKFVAGCLMPWREAADCGARSDSH